MRFVETGGGSDYVGFQGPAAITTNLLWTLPASDGSANQCLATNGSGALTWVSASGASLSGYERVNSAGTLLVAGGTGSDTVTCPGAKYVVGGGCYANAASVNNIQSFASSNQVWSCGFTNASGSNATIYAYAVCASTGADSPEWSTVGLNIANSNSGSVGIGTTNPLNKFQVKIATNMNFGVTSGSADPSAVKIHGFNDAGSANVPVEFAGSKFNFAGGSVGIGTTAPSYKFHVTGEAGFFGTTGYGVHAQSTNNYGIYGQSTSATYGGVLGYTANGTYYGILGYQNAYSFYGNGAIYNTANGSYPSVYGYNTSSNYGVRGYSVASYGMYGQSGAAAYGGVIGYTQNGSYYGILGHANQYAMYGAGDIAVTGCVNGSLGTCVSDERLKRNVQSVDLGLSEVVSLRPVTFEYNGLGGTKLETGIKRWGFIAQEVEKVAPELVHERKVKLHPEDKEDTTIKAVDYQAFPSLMINAIRELYQLWFTDHARIAQLEKENQELKRRLDSLELKLNAK